MEKPPSKLDRQLSNYLRERMKAEGLTYPQMGKLAGTSGATIHRLIHCERSATLKMLSKILKGLGAQLGDVFGDSKK